MPENPTSKTTAGNTAVPHHGDHDRVQMLSLHADGTADQHNPEIIGDREFALAAAKRQFAEQAVSAVDVDHRSVTDATAVTTIGTAGDKPDETVPLTTDAVGKPVSDLQKAQDAAAKAAEAAAEATVDALLPKK